MERQTEGERKQERQLQVTRQVLLMKDREQRDGSPKNENSVIIYSFTPFQIGE